MISESEFLATQDVGVGYDVLMGMVTDFVQGQRDGENLKSMDEMSQFLGMQCKHKSSHWPAIVKYPVKILIPTISFCYYICYPFA